MLLLFWCFLISVPKVYCWEQDASETYDSSAPLWKAKHAKNFMQNLFMLLMSETNTSEVPKTVQGSHLAL